MCVCVCVREREIGGVEMVEGREREGSLVGSNVFKFPQRGSNVENLFPNFKFRHFFNRQIESPTKPLSQKSG